MKFINQLATKWLHLTAAVPLIVVALFVAMPVAAEEHEVDSAYAAYEAGDYETALREWTNRANENEAEAQHNLALMYFKGHGVEQNYATAARWYRSAAEQELEESQHNLALMYFKGHGVEQNYATAAEWYRRAAEQGYTRSQHNLAVMYFKGYEGVPRNRDEGLRWYRRSTEQTAENPLGSTEVRANMQDGRGFFSPENWKNENPGLFSKGWTRGGALWP